MSGGLFEEPDTAWTENEFPAYLCSCNKILKTAQDVEEHKKSWKNKHGHGKRCPDAACGRHFPNVYNTKRHFISKHINPLTPGHKCFLCLSVYRQEKDLMSHMAREECVFGRRKVPNILAMSCDWQVDINPVDVSYDAFHGSDRQTEPTEHQSVPQSPGDMGRYLGVCASDASHAPMDLDFDLDGHRDAPQQSSDPSESDTGPSGLPFESLSTFTKSIGPDNVRLELVQTAASDIASWDAAVHDLQWALQVSTGAPKTYSERAEVSANVIQIDPKAIRVTGPPSTPPRWSGQKADYDEAFMNRPECLENLQDAMSLDKAGMEWLLVQCSEVWIYISVGGAQPEPRVSRDISAVVNDILLAFSVTEIMQKTYIPSVQNLLLITDAPVFWISSHEVVDPSSTRPHHTDLEIEVAGCSSIQSFLDEMIEALLNISRMPHSHKALDARTQICRMMSDTIQQHRRLRKLMSSLGHSLWSSSHLWMDIARLNDLY